ncbi:phage tail protein, partial [Campylobacter sp. 2018MI10]
MTIITNAGKKLITHAIINKLDLFISKVVYADYNLDTLDENTASLTNIKYENLPTSVRIDEFDNSKIILEAVLKNDTAQDFFINCVGFIAKNGELLCFTKINRTFVQSAVNNTNASLFHYKLAMELKHASELSIKIDETIVYPTLAHFNASQKAQDELIAKLGLDKVNISDFTASQNLQDEKIKTLENTKADKAALNNYYTKTETYTKAEIDKKDTDKYNALNNAKADKTQLNNYYTKTESNNLLNAKVNTNTYTTEQNAQNTRLTNLESSRA